MFKVCEEPLTAVCAADGGKHVAVGTKSGDVRFVKMTDFMGEFEKNDKYDKLLKKRMHFFKTTSICLFEMKALTSKRI